MIKTMTSSANKTVNVKPLESSNDNNNNKQIMSTFKLNLNETKNDDKLTLNNQQKRINSKSLTGNQWHWLHYHKPYNFGSNLPKFNDYEQQQQQQHMNESSSLITDSLPSFDLTGYIETQFNWFPFEQKTKNSLLNKILKQHETSFIPFNNQQSTTTLIKHPFKLIKNIPIPIPIQTQTFDHLAQLSCDSGEMIIRLNFSEPFKGIVYPDYNRLSPCRFFGDGHHNYELRLPLRGCGTRQVS